MSNKAKNAAEEIKLVFVMHVLANDEDEARRRGAIHED